MNITQEILVVAIKEFYAHQDTASLRVVGEAFSALADECSNVDESTHVKRMVDKFKSTLDI